MQRTGARAGRSLDVLDRGAAGEFLEPPNVVRGQHDPLGQVEPQTMGARFGRTAENAANNLVPRPRGRRRCSIRRQVWCSRDTRRRRHHDQPPQPMGSSGPRDRERQVRQRTGHEADHSPCRSRVSSTQASAAERPTGAVRGRALGVSDAFAARGCPRWCAARTDSGPSAPTATSMAVRPHSSSHCQIVGGDLRGGYVAGGRENRDDIRTSRASRYNRAIESSIPVSTSTMKRGAVDHRGPPSAVTVERCPTAKFTNERLNTCRVRRHASARHARPSTASATTTCVASTTSENWPEPSGFVSIRPVGGRCTA